MRRDRFFAFVTLMGCGGGVFSELDAAVADLPEAELDDEAGSPFSAPGSLSKGDSWSCWRESSLAALLPSARRSSALAVSLIERDEERRALGVCDISMVGQWCSRWYQRGAGRLRLLAGDVLWREGQPAECEDECSRLESQRSE